MRMLLIPSSSSPFFSKINFPFSISEFTCSFVSLLLFSISRHCHIIMIMSLCKKRVQSFNMDAAGDDVGDAYRSSRPPPPPPSSATPLFSLFSKKDPGGIGFIDDMGGGVDGLMSCTESLGFESSDERIDHHQTAEMDAMTDHNQLSSKTGWRKDHHHHHHHHHHRKEVKMFPPPLSSFNRNGQPSFFLRSVRGDGRLELTGFTTDRPEILRASRKDGRLKLHLIREDENNNEVDIDVEHNEYEEDEETLEPEEDEGEGEGEEAEEEEEEEEEEGVGESSLEGLSRCNEMIGQQHHHQSHHHQRHDHLHVWSHQCVPTR